MGWNRSSVERLMLVAYFIAAPIAYAQAPVIDGLKVIGAQRFDSASVIAASGLYIGEPFSPKVLDEAKQRLLETGMFSAVTFRSQPQKSGRLVSLTIQEALAETEVRFDVPGIDEQELWSALDRHDTLIRRHMPESSKSVETYRLALEETLRSKFNRTVKIAAKSESDLGSGKITRIFRPANADRISSIRFTGNPTMADEVLEAAVRNSVNGLDYSGQELRRVLELNIRPFYDERGYLTMKFAKVVLENAGAATVDIDEGPVWKLGRVDITGSDLPLDTRKYPIGQIANWKQVEAALDQTLLSLKHAGYLHASLRSLRSFSTDGSHIVNLEIKADKGKQFLFGELQLSGLSDLELQRVKNVWNLKTGDPMDVPYLDDYLKTMFKVLKTYTRSVSTELIPRSGSNVVDVQVRFK